jgi:hypothetical protein
MIRNKSLNRSRHENSLSSLDSAAAALATPTPLNSSAGSRLSGRTPLVEQQNTNTPATRANSKNNRQTPISLLKAFSSTFRYWYSVMGTWELVGKTYVFGPPRYASGSLKNEVKVLDPGPHPDPYVFGPPGFASRSVNQRCGSEDSDPHPDPYQNVTDPQHQLCS